MPVRRLLSLIVIAVLLPLTACTDEAISFGNVDPDNADWITVAGRDLNCAEGVELTGLEHHDITGDRDNEAFVVMRCKDPKIRADQLEVFDGAKPATDPPIAVLTRNWMDSTTYPLTMEDGCVSMVGDQVIVRGSLVSSDSRQQKPRKIQKVWTWTKSSEGHRQLVFSTFSVDPPKDPLTTLCFD